MGDFESVVGMVTLQFDGNTPSLVFTGPDVPGLDGVSPTMILRYDPDQRRLQVRAGLSHDDDSMTVDLLNLPDDWRQQITKGGQTGSSTRVRLTAPQCSSLQSGGRFLSYEEYQAMVRMARATPQTSGPVNLFDPNMLRRAAMAALYPPLTRQIFDRLVARCRGRMILGM